MPHRVEDWFGLILAEAERTLMLQDRGKSYTEKLLRFKDYHTHCKDAQVITMFVFNENKSKHYVINSD